jgi:hypothetical protein
MSQELDPEPSMFYELDIVKPIVTLQFAHYYFSMKNSSIPNEFISNAHYQQVWIPHLKNEVWSMLLNQKAQQKLNGIGGLTVFPGLLKKDPDHEK